VRVPQEWAFLLEGGARCCSLFRVIRIGGHRPYVGAMVRKIYVDGRVSGNTRIELEGVAGPMKGLRTHGWARDLEKLSPLEILALQHD